MANQQVCLLFMIIIITFISTSAKPDVYIVHMDQSAMPASFSDHHSWFMSTVASLSDKITTTTTTTTTTQTTPSELLYSYSHVMHGFCASVSISELEKLKNTHGYISSIRDFPVRPDTTHSSQFLGLNSNSGAWVESKYGQDVIIGLVDTGVWPESASFNDDGFSEIPSKWKGQCEVGTQFDSSMCNKKLIGARYFNKGLIANNPDVKISMNSTRDIDGHGTHTSTTAAGNNVKEASYFGYATGTAGGMAPKARVAMYKALWDVGAVTSDIIAAIDQAIADGVDVLSLSLGLDGVPFYEDPVAIATFAALQKGIFVTTSAGNEGPYLGTIHNGTPWVLTVGAGTLDREFGGAVTLGNGVKVVGSSLYPGNITSLNQVPIVFMAQCDSSKALKKVGYKIVVCSDTNDTLSDQVTNVRAANVAGGIFVTNNTDLEFFIQSSFPATFVSVANGEPIIDYIGTKNKSNLKKTASIDFRKTMLGTRPAPRVASYSSRGPSSSCPFVLKPDLIAPGEFILASWPQNVPVTTVGSRQLLSDFNFLSGTSMSCPHVAGIAALLKVVHPTWSPAAIRSALMTTSNSADNTLSPITDAGDNNKVATPWAMGSGHVNPNKALDPGLVYDAGLEDYVNLLCAMNYTMSQIQIVTRAPPNSFNCSNSSLDLNYPSFIAYFNRNDTKGTQTVQEFQRTVTNVGKDMTTYTAKLTKLDGFEVSVVPDKLVFKNKYEKQSYKLSIKGPSMMNEMLVFSYLSWVDIAGQYVVQSPIVATRLSADPLPARN